MKDITLRQIEYFLAVLDRGSLSAAAAASNVSQATVSAALSQLEKQLNVTLIARGPARRARPTSAGREFGIRARSVLATVTEAVESVNEDSAVLHGPLRIGCIPTAAPRMLPGTASCFERQFPDIDISFVEAHPTTIQQMILAGEVDLAVMYRKQVQIEGLKKHPLSEVQLHALVSADHPLAKRRGVDIAELVGDPLILLDSPPTADLLIGQIRGLGHEPNVRWLLPNAETIRSMVAWGLGFSLANAVPHPDIRSFQGMKVTYLPVTNPEFSNTIVGVTVEDARMLKKVTTALDVLRQVAEDTAPSNWAN
ncbi:LysR family transcriptional regulator [Brevibacterium picturae]|uniref:LysR family transcriptional regulator n=1 Tax=Brevibacterium picturae TaxID=260553 RepID=A0ABP4LQA6_9MICO